jgi:ribonuclease BN (tRNA processing enzyme)
MEYCYFPVREAELKADIRYISLHEMETIEIGPTRITNIMMNHTALNFGYLIESKRKKVFFTGDNEKLSNIYNPDDSYYGEYEGLIQEKDKKLIDFIQGVDVLIADAAYTSDEYPAKKGWGHGTYDFCIQIAKEAGARSLYFTHHEPLRSDDELETIMAGLQKKYSPAENMPTFHLAREGLEITL